MKNLAIEREIRVVPLTTYDGGGGSIAYENEISNVVIKLKKQDALFSTLHSSWTAGAHGISSLVL